MSLSCLDICLNYYFVNLDIFLDETRLFYTNKSASSGCHICSLVVKVE